MHRSKSLALMFVLGAVLTGAALGFTADRILIGDSRCPQVGDRRGWRDRFAARLDLTDSQQVAVDSILADKHRQISGLIDPIRPQLDSIGDNARAQIARQLTPEQRLKFEQFTRQSKRSRESNR